MFPTNNFLSNMLNCIKVCISNLKNDWFYDLNKSTFITNIKYIEQYKRIKWNWTKSIIS